MTIATNFITAFMTSAMNLSAPDISREFSVGASSIGWIITIYTLSSAAFAVPFGKMADAFGRKKILLAGLSLFCISSFLILFSQNFAMLLLLRFAQGTGGAMILATNIAILSASCPDGTRGKALGIGIAFAYIGMSLGPVFGGFLNYALGWRAILIFVFALSAITLVAVALKLPSDAALKTGEKIDVLGSAFFIAALSLLMYGMSSFDSLAGRFCAAIGAALFLLFLRHESVVTNPIVNLKLFKENRGYALSNVAAMINFGATYMISYLLSIYLQAVKGFDSHTAGMIMIAQPVVIALLTTYIGNLSDRVSPYRLSSIGMLFCAGGLFAFSFLTQDSSTVQIVMSLMLVGLGFAFFSSPNTNAIMACVKPKDLGMASSVLTTMRSIGSTSSMAGITLIISCRLGNIPLEKAAPAEIVSTMRFSFLLFAGICLGGMYLSSKRSSGAVKKLPRNSASI